LLKGTLIEDQCELLIGPGAIAIVAMVVKPKPCVKEIAKYRPTKGQVGRYPSEPCGLEFKGKFGRFGSCSVSVTISVDWSFFDSRRHRPTSTYRQEIPSAPSHPLSSELNRESDLCLGDREILMPPLPILALAA
jgi:hypothetical protein